MKKPMCLYIPEYGAGDGSAYGCIVSIPEGTDEAVRHSLDKFDAIAGWIAQKGLPAAEGAPQEVADAVRIVPVDDGFRAGIVLGNVFDSFVPELSGKEFDGGSLAMLTKEEAESALGVNWEEAFGYSPSDRLESARVAVLLEESGTPSLMAEALFDASDPEAGRACVSVSLKDLRGHIEEALAKCREADEEEADTVPRP